MGRAYSLMGLVGGDLSPGISMVPALFAEIVRWSLDGCGNNRSDGGRDVADMVAEMVVEMVAEMCS